MDFALLLSVSAVVGGGVLGALVRAWSIHSRLYSLEDRVNVAEGILTREVKTRAATERWSKPTKNEQSILEAMVIQPAGQIKKPKWWETAKIKRLAGER